jgi:prepilin signal peptidase PulO-like enzyme (type II secretory pathway)
MVAILVCFAIGAALGFFASEFADRWGCSQRYRSSLPKKMFILCTSGIVAALLYWWEVQMGMLYPPSHSARVVIGADIVRYISHLLLFTFLLAATLTDFYEMIISDSITVGGTISVLWVTFFLPVSLPVTEIRWTDDFFPVFVPYLFMHVWSPNPFGASSLLVMTLLWWFWCFAMLDRVWYTKLPFRKANAIFWRYLCRSPRTTHIVAIAVVFPACFALVIHINSGLALFSALVGMAAGMVLVWGVRIVARWVLGVEAMGFGDVTLMGMIGAFLGWQAVLLVFFLAPFFGLVYGIVHVALGKGRAVPYGPFLCLATVTVVIFWRFLWQETAEYFAFGIGTIGIALLVLLVLFGGLLHVVHRIFSR